VLKTPQEAASPVAKGQQGVASVEMSGSRPSPRDEVERLSRKPYFSRNEAGMRKMLVKGRFKVLENRSRFVLLVSSSSIRVSRN
jgi:hypothetical protein